MKRIFIILLCLVLSPAYAGSPQNKKIIEYGNDVQNTTSVRRHVREYEAMLPFDGLIMVVSARNGLTLGWHVFSTEKLDPADFQNAIDDLKATRFRKFTDNFLQICSGAGIDWFDPNWSNVAYNASLFARAAKQGGCKGIMFDPEMYSGRLWSYVMEDGKPRPGHTFVEYRAKARERGREFIMAINKEFPDLTILCLFGPSQLYVETLGNPESLPGAPNVLLSAFYDGVCEAATPGTVLVDGFENSYGYRRRSDFIKARRKILEGSLLVSTDPAALKKHLRVGFGLGPDYTWNPGEFSKNYFSPAGARAAASYALEMSDRYVWVFSTQLHWLGGKPPKEYVDALQLAKKGPGPGEKNPARIIPSVAGATTIPGYDDATTFAEMRKTMTGIFDFPKTGWRFGIDEYEVGQKNAWYKTGFNDSAWPKMEIGKFWEDQGELYDGIAWYRMRFTAPKAPTAKRVFVVFGAVDDIAKVWLNGQYVGQHDIPLGWSIPFALDVTKVIKRGQPNVLAVEVIDNGGPGGIWKNVRLMTK